MGRLVSGKYTSKDFAPLVAGTTGRGFSTCLVVGDHENGTPILEQRLTTTEQARLQFCFRRRLRKRENLSIAAYPPARLACDYVIDQRRWRDPMNLGSILQHESHPTVRINDLLRWPAIRREARVHRLSILWRTPLPPCQIEMLRNLHGAVDRRCEPTKSLTVEGAPHGPGRLDFLFQLQKGRFIDRETNALPCRHAFQHRSRRGSRFQRTEGKVPRLRARMCCG